MIDAQWGGGRGFDFISVRMVNGQPQLILNEVKRYSNPISASRFTAFGMGRGGPRIMELNLDVARARIDAIPNTVLTDAQKQILLNQISNGTAQIRIIARRSLVSNETRDFIQDQTGLLTQVGF